MDKIKILYTISELVYGSKVRQLIDLIKEIDMDRFDIEIGTYHIRDEASNEILDLDVPIKHIWLQPPRNLDWRRNYVILKSPKLIWKKYDIIHSLHYSSLFIEPLIAKAEGIKYVYTKTNLKWKNHPVNWKVKSALSDRIISISRHVNKLLIRNGFENKTTFLPIGIDTQYFTRYTRERKASIRIKREVPVNSFVFGCAAQYVKSKRQDLIISAFNELAKKYDNIFLVLCGVNYKDQYFNDLNNLIERCEISSKILQLGIVSDMRMFYNMIDCFALPSIDEALGLVFIEAMSCGVPVIGCKNTGAEEIIMPECGILVEQNDIDGLRDAMEYYLLNNNDLAEIGNMCSHIVEKNFSHKRIVKKHEELYKSLM